ncbi:MAG: DUF58 domain-containing protein, partial [Altererythrobacter sp.]|nr:DUF58 domain-containing protein [Altererythrobacter sp.]
MSINLPFVPTERAAWIAAGAAPVAVLLGAVAPGAWVIAPAGAAALFTLVLLDAFLAGQLANWDVDAPADAEVGEAFPIQANARFAKGRAPARIKAALQFDPRLGEEGRA